ncbi:period circadian protein homolog 2 isoform X1 [Syngnathus acus]|uniref:period circadian protein homolog 2 isoform X1 n=2 Tax=Syngnathus acus TaxID=161584 RepID=UPI001885DC48|nr:period circadian protein homolog 2 isoform X1 [Syngnathus acus]XP_037132035.1 period circadian protein homolog 2 isoform X1 [Syngnathus acus]
MSEDSDAKHYCFSVLEDQDGRRASCCPVPRGASGCGSVAQRLSGYGQGGPELGLPSEGSDSSGHEPARAGPRKLRKSSRSLSLLEEDVEMKSSGSSGSGTESHGNRSRGRRSNGGESVGSSNSNSKDSALLESSVSNKSSNSHSSSPPSSSNAFSLLGSEQDNPSTSGCSSQESAKAKTQKEVLKTLKELKLYLPAEKRHGSKSSTLNTLKYALRCVKQVEANEEYYQQLMTNDSQPSGLDVSSYTIDEIDSITSEYTLKNNDIFAVAVSLITGKIVYISDQAASILNCKRDVFNNSKFVEFLIPQDVSVFYNSTTPYQLPSWSMCTGAESLPPDCMQEKSFFCRISGGKECKGDLQYYPFRMTPYLMKVQVTAHAEDQFCCLLLAERVHSGYDAPRIPTDKRVFTTTHSPGCVFQDVDERAVPLLGYLPQDLIGTSILLHLHPNDRPIMLAIHRKILQYAGQPFDHSSIRFCARNGEYVILDTSWSSFVNPWSRKVSFVIGRHKVRTGPVNEDVFMAPLTAGSESKAMDSDIHEITEQIHRLLLQPVHNSGSSGYRSLNSSDHLLGMTSSTESLNNGSKFHQEDNEEEEVSSKARPRTFQEICKGVHLQKHQEQCSKMNSMESDQKSPAVVRPKDLSGLLSWKENVTPMEESKSSSQEEMPLNDQKVYSYQQISCLDSIVRYLENCNVPYALKRKCQSSSNTTSSDEDKHQMQASQEPALLKDHSGLSALDHPDKKSSDAARAVVGTSLPLPLPNKPESVVSITSQCSYSSTIVHVGDKKPQQESEITEDVSGAGEAAECGHNPLQTAPPSWAFSPRGQERESYRKLGLTKQVLAAHTQKEEQAFLVGFKELRKLTALKANCSQYLERHREKNTNDVSPAAQRAKRSGPGCKLNAGQRAARNRKTKSKRAKQTESSDSTASYPRQQQQPPRGPPLNQGLNPTSWSASDTSQSMFPAAFPGFPLQVFPSDPSVVALVNTPLQGFADNQGAPPCPPGVTHSPYVAPMVMALVLPNYLYPALGPGPQQPAYHPEMGQATFPGQATIMTPAPFNPQRPYPPQVGYVTPSFYFPPPASEAPKVPAEGQSRASTPQSASPPLFQSRCSSPLNLLELELSGDRQDGTTLPPGGQGANATEREKAAVGSQTKELNQPSLSLLGPPGPLSCEGTIHVCERLSWDKGMFSSRLRACSSQASSRGDCNNSDNTSLSSDMLDIILQEDSCSGTGSATSGSVRSRSNGYGTSASGTSNGRTSNSGISASGADSNSSKYFGSVDSSQKSQKVKGHPDDSDNVLRDPVWLLMAKADDKVMMTYQMPSRDIQKVLKEDREKLSLMQKSQPSFTEEQKKELMRVHPWMKKGGLPKVLDVKVCSCCDGAIHVPPTDDLLDLELVEQDPLVEGHSQSTPQEDPSSVVDSSVTSQTQTSTFH